MAVWARQTRVVLWSPSWITVPFDPPRPIQPAALAQVCFDEAVGAEDVSCRRRVVATRGFGGCLDRIDVRNVWNERETAVRRATRGIQIVACVWFISADVKGLLGKNVATKTGETEGIGWSETAQHSHDDFGSCMCAHRAANSREQLPCLPHCRLQQGPEYYLGTYTTKYIVHYTCT